MQIEDMTDRPSPERTRHLVHRDIPGGHLSYFVDVPAPVPRPQATERAPIKPQPAIVRYGADGSEDAVLLDRPAGPVRRMLGRLARWMR